MKGEGEKTDRMTAGKGEVEVGEKRGGVKNRTDEHR